MFNDFLNDSLTVNNRDKLQVLQNNCVRICLKSNRLRPRVELYAQSGIKPLESPRTEHTATIIYLGLNQESASIINKLFSQTSTGGKLVLRLQIMSDVIVASLGVCRGNIR